MFHIEDGRTHFWQWDINQRLLIDEAAAFDEVHFSTMALVDSYIKKPYQEDGKIYVEVPNQLLEKPWDISVYGWDKTHTKYKQVFEVAARAKPQDYEETIANVPTAEELTLSGNCDYMFFGNRLNFLIDRYADKITVKDMTSAKSMFYYCDWESIPFSLEPSELGCVDYSGLFAYMENVKYIAPISIKATQTGELDFRRAFVHCHNLRELPQIKEIDYSNRGSRGMKVFTSSAFAKCCSLRSVPKEYFELFVVPWEGYISYSVSSPYYQSFYYCCSLDELTGVFPIGAETTFEITDNLFQQFVTDCRRLKEFTFAIKDDGTPYKTNWKAQRLFLNVIGWDAALEGEPSYSLEKSDIISYNSGITEETRITDAESYQRLKNHPDSWTTLREYSRYNHDSAVRTINSLPDTSDYLATAGGTNTIHFTGEAGSLTDGGAINTLTEEEIAIAAAKGWTVAYVSY